MNIRFIEEERERGVRKGKKPRGNGGQVKPGQVRSGGRRGETGKEKHECWTGLGGQKASQ